MKKIIFLIGLMGLSCCLNSQSATFSKLFDFYPLNGENGLIIQAVEDGYLLLSSNDCVSFVTPNPECRTITKIDQQGSVDWVLELDMTVDWTVSFLEVGDGYLMTGHDRNMIFGVPLVKISKQGQLLWKKKVVNLPMRGGGTSMRLNDEGNIVVLGSHQRQGLTGFAWLPFWATVTTDGEEIELFTFNHDYNTTFPYRLLTATNGRYLASYTYCPTGCDGFNTRGGIIAMNPYGNILWRKELPAVFAPHSCIVEQLDAHEYAYLWYHTQFTDIQWELHSPAVYYMDAEGNVNGSVIMMTPYSQFRFILNSHAVWGKGLIGSGKQFLKINNSGPGSQIWTGWLFRVDQNRQILWQRNYIDTLNSGQSNGFYHVKSTNDGGFIACGDITNRMTGVIETHAWLLKLDSMGCVQPGCNEVNYVTNTESAVFKGDTEVRCAPNPASTETYVMLPEDYPDRDVVIALLSPEGRLLHRETYAHPGVRLPLHGAGSGMHYVAAYRQGRLLGVAKLIVQR